MRDAGWAMGEDSPPPGSPIPHPPSPIPHPPSPIPLSADNTTPCGSGPDSGRAVSTPPDPSAHRRHVENAPVANGRDDGHEQESRSRFDDDDDDLDRGVHPRGAKPAHL